MFSQIVMNAARLVTGSALFMCIGLGLFAEAGPIETPHTHDIQTTDAERAMHDAEHMVDEAWEVYHEAALGGTLASPALQAQIERDLHDARKLLVEARQVANRGSKDEFHRILSRIKTLSARAIQGSRETKK